MKRLIQFNLTPDDEAVIMPLPALLDSVLACTDENKCCNDCPLYPYGHCKEKLVDQLTRYRNAIDGERFNSEPEVTLK